jgi:hypothetical protein
MSCVPVAAAWAQLGSEASAYGTPRNAAYAYGWLKTSNARSGSPLVLAGGLRFGMRGLFHLESLVGHSEFLHCDVGALGVEVGRIYF